MFDSHYHGGGSTHIDVRTTVTEKRAPTDESVRLLKEMEKAAADKVQASVRVSDTNFDAVVHIGHDCMTGDKTVAVFFSLNSKKMRVDCAIRMGESQEAAVNKIIDAVSQRIAFELIAPCFTHSLMQQLK